MKTSLALVLSVLLYFSSNAQPSGYLGKRFTLSYEQLTGPNYFYLLRLDNFDRDDLEGGSIGEENASFNYLGSISIDYVVNNTKSRGFSLSPINQKMYYRDYTSDISDVNHRYFVNNAKLSGLTVGLYVKYYKKNRIAPLGQYYKIELLYSTYQMKSFYKEAELYKKAKNKIEPFSTLGLSVTFGKNHIVWDKIVLSAGITTGMRLSFLGIPFSSVNGVDESAINELNIAARFWHGQNLFYNLHLGVGWLIF